MLLLVMWVPETVAVSSWCLMVGLQLLSAVIPAGKSQFLMQAVIQQYSIRPQHEALQYHSSHCSAESHV